MSLLIRIVEMRRLDVVLAGQVCDGAAEFEDAVAGTGDHVYLLYRDAREIAAT
jgi:hypothetical protein